MRSGRIRMSRRVSNAPLLGIGLERGSAEPLHRQICDYIAGMTDGYFRRVFEELVGHRSEPRVK